MKEVSYPEFKQMLAETIQLSGLSTQPLELAYTVLVAFLQHANATKTNKIKFLDVAGEFRPLLRYCLEVNNIKPDVCAQLDIMYDYDIVTTHLFLEVSKSKVNIVASYASSPIEQRLFMYLENEEIILDDSNN